MDNPNTNNNSAYDRSDEELSWDAEFADMDEPRTSSYTAMLADIAKLIAQVPAAAARMPMALLPEDTARHARAAAREGFLALRSLLAAIGDSIESALAEPSGKATTPTVAGPTGTWGTARHGNTSSASSPIPPGKARRIEVSDEVSERSGGDGQPTVKIDDLGEQEGRGLRADIDY
jgi:hypothetical protein